MDPPPPPSHPAAAVASHLGSSYPDSTNSSPRSHQTADTWEEPLALPQVPGAKLRLMCSYGGHIIPRPHDKSLCYVGGDTRIVVVDRGATLADLHSRISLSLLNGRAFTLKYQLPTEDLDSLVSVTTDEDLENMIEEYDRINSTSPLKPSRLRLFLFTAKPETAASMGCLLDDAKSETWFVDALNGAGLLPRGLSDSAAIDHNLMELHDDPRINPGNLHQMNQMVNMVEQTLNNNINGSNQVSQEIQSTFSDSPMVETTSSFESGVSSPSMTNLPFIKVRMDEAQARMGGGGLEEQFSRMNVAHSANVPVAVNVAVPPLPAVVGGGGRENSSRAISDDEKSEQGNSNGKRKPPLPLQPVPRKAGGGDPYNLPSPDSKQPAGSYNLPSPDSVASDSSVASATSFSRNNYQETVPASTREIRAPTATVDQRSYADPSAQNQMQQQQQAPAETMVNLQQSQLQQLMQTTGGHYIQQPGTGQMPMPSYYQVYATPQQQQQMMHHQQMDQQQQYPMYFMPVPQTQPYNQTMQQSNSADSGSVSVGRPTTTFVPSTAYKEMAPPANYPVKPTTPQPEMMQSMYRTTGPGNPTLVQVPASQFQQQFGISQAQNPSQASGVANYSYEYAHPTHDHPYYAQYSTATLPQYQTMAPGAAVMLAQTSKPNQLVTDNTTAEQ